MGGTFMKHFLDLTALETTDRYTDRQSETKYFGMGNYKETAMPVTCKSSGVLFPSEFSYQFFKSFSTLPEQM